MKGFTNVTVTTVSILAGLFVVKIYGACKYMEGFTERGKIIAKTQ